MSYYYTQVFKHYQPKPLSLTGSTSELYSDFKKTNILICGENHGVRENADLAYTLCKTLGITRLAIERSASTFKPFLESAITGKPNFLLPQALLSLQASVLSLEMLKTIVVLVREQPIAVNFVDLDSQANPTSRHISQQQYMKTREFAIAKNILELEEAQPTLVLLGNYHTRPQPDTVVGQSALQIVRQTRASTSLNYQYSSGAFYNAGKLGHFPSRQSKVQPHKYEVSELSKSNFIITVPSAHRILV